MSDSLNYRGYLKRLNDGKAQHHAASPLRNRGWLMREAANHARDQQLAPLLEALDAA